MNGQWIGRYSGTNSGLLVIDLDDMGTHYEGRAFAYDDNPSMPSTFAFIKTPDKSSTFQLSLDLLPVNPHTGNPSFAIIIWQIEHLSGGPKSRKLSSFFREDQCYTALRTAFSKMREASAANRGGDNSLACDVEFWLNDGSVNCKNCGRLLSFF
jgi:hypothetical protein